MNYYGDPNSPYYTKRIKHKCPICENKNAWKEDKKEFNIDDVKKSVKHLIYLYCEECGYLLDFEMY